MSIRRRILAAIALLGAPALLPAWSHPAHAQDAPADTIRLIVENRSGLWPDGPDLDCALYIASSANGWDPAAQAHAILAFPRSSDTREFMWVFDLPREIATRRDFQFKFTRGSWATVEVAADGSDIPNRTLEGHDPATADEIRLVLHGFADQRGTRWSDAPKPGESTVTGRLDVFAVPTEHLDAPRTVCVWLPPGYADPANTERRYPVLYMHDGQNCFDDATSFAGEWGLDETVTELVEGGVIEPIIVVGIDNHPTDRGAEYNPPYTEFRGRKNFGDRHLAFLTEDLIPLVNERYRTRTGPEHTGLGGSSFGGNATLYALMARPGLFSRVLVESPAVVVSEGAIIDRLRAFEGPWPERVFIGVGTAESAAESDAEAYVRAVRALADVFDRRAPGPTRVRLVVDEGAVHNEGAWARRLPEALAFLWAPSEEEKE